MAISKIPADGLNLNVDNCRVIYYDEELRRSMVNDWFTLRTVYISIY